MIREIFLFDDDLHRVEFPCRCTGEAWITFRNRKKDIHSFNYLSENRVMEIQPGCRNMCDEELGTVRIRTGICHGKDSRFIMLQFGNEFILELISRTAHTGTGRITALGHEIFDNTMKDRIIIKTVLGKKNKIVNGNRCFIGKESALNVPFVRMKYSGIFFLKVQSKFRFF